MPLRFRLYRWLRRSRGARLRWWVLNALIMVGFGTLVALLNLQFGTKLEERWGLVIFYSFLNGFTAVVVFNTVLELLGAGYQPQDQSRGR